MPDLFNTYTDVRPYAVGDGEWALLPTADDFWPVRIEIYGGYADVMDEALVTITNPDTKVSWVEWVGLDELVSPVA